MRRRLTLSVLAAIVVAAPIVAVLAMASPEPESVVQQAEPPIPRPDPNRERDAPPLVRHTDSARMSAPLENCSISEDGTPTTCIRRSD